MCPLCKTDSLERTTVGSIENPVVLVRCSACGFSWTETTNKINGKDIVTIKIVR